MKILLFTSLFASSSKLFSNYMKNKDKYHFSLQFLWAKYAAHETMIPVLQRKYHSFLIGSHNQGNDRKQQMFVQTTWMYFKRLPQEASLFYGVLLTVNGSKSEIPKEFIMKSKREAAFLSDSSFYWSFSDWCER